MFSERASNFTRDSIGEETKTKWNKVVEKSKSLNETMTTAMRPALKIYNSTVDTIGEKFYNSENSIIKTIRGNEIFSLEYSLALAKSLNEGQ